MLFKTGSRHHMWMIMSSKIVFYTKKTKTKLFNGNEKWMHAGKLVNNYQVTTFAIQETWTSFVEVYIKRTGFSSPNKKVSFLNINTYISHKNNYNDGEHQTWTQLTRKRYSRKCFYHELTLWYNLWKCNLRQEECGKHSGTAVCFSHNYGSLLNLFSIFTCKINQKKL